MKLPAVEPVLTANIEVTNRLRALVPERVDALAASMAEIGLKTPITVRAKDDIPYLVAGRHRLAAAIKLGWKEIGCFVVVDDDIDAQLWEIDENLARAELTPAEIASHMARRKELVEQKTWCKLRHVSRKRGPGRGGSRRKRPSLPALIKAPSTAPSLAA